jgi:Mg2+/citrate symporter
LGLSSSPGVKGFLRVLGFLKSEIMALFICGLFTGMATMIALGMWLNEREKKRKAKKPNAAGLDIFIAGQRIASLKSTELDSDMVTEKTKGEHWIRFDEWDRFFNSPSLKDQLQSAI